ncbi:hypothetical protein, partial [Burkholderia multivorans]
MDVNLDLAMWSNQLIVSAMVVYAVAMIFYAFDLFGGRELKRSEGATVAAKPSTVRRTNRRTATALLDRPGAGDDSGSGAASGGAEDLKGRARRGAR